MFHVFGHQPVLRHVQPQRGCAPQIPLRRVRQGETRLALKHPHGLLYLLRGRLVIVAWVRNQETSFKSGTVIVKGSIALASARLGSCCEIAENLLASGLSSADFLQLNQSIITVPTDDSLYPASNKA